MSPLEQELNRLWDIWECASKYGIGLECVNGRTVLAAEPPPEPDDEEAI